MLRGESFGSDSDCEHVFRMPLNAVITAQQSD